MIFLSFGQRQVRSLTDSFNVMSRNTWMFLFQEQKKPEWKSHNIADNETIVHGRRHSTLSTHNSFPPPLQVSHLKRRRCCAEGQDADSISASRESVREREDEWGNRQGKQMLQMKKRWEAHISQVEDRQTDRQEDRHHKVFIWLLEDGRYSLRTQTL